MGLLTFAWVAFALLALTAGFALVSTPPPTIFLPLRRFVTKVHTDCPLVKMLLARGKGIACRKKRGGHVCKYPPRREQKCYMYGISRQN